MDAVGPDVDVALGGEIAPASAQVLVRPSFLELSDDRGREPAGVLAEQGNERFLKVAGGDALRWRIGISTWRLFDRRAYGGKIADER
jgi:hypothetical protein